MWLNRSTLRAEFTVTKSPPTSVSPLCLLSIDLLVLCAAQQEEKLIALILKMSKEQGLCLQGNKVMIFTVEKEGLPNEEASFKIVDVDEE